MKHLIFITVLFLSSIAVQAKEYSNKMIARNVAIFYPNNFNAKENLPSFALLKEPVAIGNIPSQWKNTPHFYMKDGKAIATLPVLKGTSLYGTGEVKGKLLRNGYDIKLWNTDNFLYSLHGGKRLYQSHPWVLGVNSDGTSFGVIADNTWKQEIDLSDSIRFISDGPAFRVIVIERKTPQEVVEELANLTGKMKLPPLWALGYQQSHYSYVPDTRVEGIADTFRLKKLPCDVIWMDIDYMDHFKIFTFDPVKIPYPKKVNNYLHKKGFKAVWMIDPGVKVEQGYSVYDSGTAGNHWVETADHQEFHGKVWPGECAFPDFTMPVTRKWWSGLYKNFMATGIDGVWNDMNEPSVFDGPDGTMPEDNWHRGGGNLPADIHKRYHNVYGMLMVKATREGIMKANPNKRPFVLSRSGYLGSSRYAATWTGDNCGTTAYMKLSVPMSLNLSLSGQPFNGPDMGGFAQNTSPEVYGQWIGMGVFFPFLRGHYSKGVNDKEPWAFGPAIEKVARVALDRRYQILPYLYTVFHESSVTGIPVMQPLFFADPKDTTLRREQQSFLVGSDMMVIPCWAQNPAMPKGIWRDMKFGGEKDYHDQYQADVKIKGGAIIPLGKIIQSTVSYNTDSITLEIALDKNGKAKGHLYQDAGQGFGYKKGEFVTTSFTAHKEGNHLIVKIEKVDGKMKLPHRNYKVVLVSDKQPIVSNWTSKTHIKIKME